MNHYETFRTLIAPLKTDKEVSYDDKIMLLGSCFTDNIGRKLKAHLFNVCANPLGILYNPSSIASALKRVINLEWLDQDEIQWMGNSFGSFEFHSVFNRSSKEDTLKEINGAIQMAHDYLLTSQHLFITLGTSYIYERKETGKVVGNCHKQPEKEFKRFRLSPNEIIMEWADLLKSLWKVNSDIQVTFTVSPIRHMRDGAVENQLSKSTLLLAVDRLIHGFSKQNIDYYPSYEIMMDDLRDYRFYKADMVHPSDVAIDYIWEHMKKSFMNNKTVTLMKDINKLVKSANHRPSNPDSQAHQQFINKQLCKINDIKNNHPAIVLDDLIHQFRQILHE